MGAPAPLPPGAIGRPFAGRAGLGTSTQAPQAGLAILLGWPVLAPLELETCPAFILHHVVQLPFDPGLFGSRTSRRGAAQRGSSFPLRPGLATVGERWWGSAPLPSHQAYRWLLITPSCPPLTPNDFPLAAPWPGSHPPAGTLTPSSPRLLRAAMCRACHPPLGTPQPPEPPLPGEERGQQHPSVRKDLTLAPWGNPCSPKPAQLLGPWVPAASRGR